MIAVFSTETAHLHSGRLTSFLRLRYREFILRQNYNVPSFNSLAFDEFGTQAAVYITWRTAHDPVQAGARFCPTTRPYMIQKHWPDSVTTTRLPGSPAIWEVTRLVMCRELAADRRAAVHAALLCALLEFGLAAGATSHIGVAPPFPFRPA